MFNVHLNAAGFSHMFYIQANAFVSGHEVQNYFDTFSYKLTKNT